MWITGQCGRCVKKREENKEKSPSVNVKRKAMEDKIHREMMFDVKNVIFPLE